MQTLPSILVRDMRKQTVSNLTRKIAALAFCLGVGLLGAYKIAGSCDCSPNANPVINYVRGEVFAAVKDIFISVKIKPSA